MFGKKLIVIAATAALALGSISAKDASTSTVHVRVHALKQASCGAGQSPMSVEGAGTYCVSGQACVANISTGACPGPQPGLESGSHCGVVKTGVYGCKPGPPPAAGAAKCDGPGQSPMSVEGAGTYCVTGQACVATISNGACPAAQPGLESGAHCAEVRPGVWGCRKGPKPAHHKHHKNHKNHKSQKGHKIQKGHKSQKAHKSHKSHSKSVCSGPGQSPMSVEGVPGVFCVTGQSCVADIGNGSCPGPQEGLPYGAHCGKVITGVYGCQPNTEPVKTVAPKIETPKTEAPKPHAPTATVMPVAHAAKHNSSVTVIIDVDVDNNDHDHHNDEDDSSDDSSDESSDDRRQ